MGPPNNNSDSEEEQEIQDADDNAQEDMEEEEEESTEKDLDELEEFSALDRQLDELNSVLDAIEAKNDDIHGKLKQFLQASRQERLELQTINLAISDKTSNESQSNDQK